MADEFSKPPPQRVAELQAARAKAEEAQRENQQTQQQRQQAPGSIKAGTEQEQMVRQAEQQAAQQRMVQENIKQIGTTSDRYSGSREAALKSGSFDYGSYGKVTPNSFVTDKGQRVERPIQPMISGGGTPNVRPSSPPSSGPERVGMSDVISTIVTRASTSKPSGASQAIQTAQSNKPQQVTTVSSPIGTATLYGKTFRTFTPTSEKNEGGVTSFLKVPFVGKKAQSGQVPSTSLADAFQFVPIGSLEKGAVSAGKEISSFFTQAFAKQAPKAAAPQAAKVGAADIGLNVPKYTQSFRTEKNIQSMISEKMKSPPASMAKAGRETTPTPDITVSLGRGTGKLVSGGREGSGLSSSGKPPTETSSGRGTVQILEKKVEPAKPTTKTEQIEKTVQEQKEKTSSKAEPEREKAMQEYQNKLKGKGSKTEQVSKLEEEEQFIQKTGLRYVSGPKQPEKSRSSPLITVPKHQGKQETKPGPVFVPPALIPIQTGKTGTTQTQKQQPDYVGLTDLITVTKIPGKPGPPPPTRQPPPTNKPPPGEGPPPDKKKLLDGALGLGGLPGLIGKVSKFGERKEFLGNVPSTDIIGVYKRGEISYGQKTIARSEKSDFEKASTGKFSQKRSGRIL